MIITIQGNPIPWKRPSWKGTRAYDAQKFDKIRYASIAKQAMIAQGLADVVLSPNKAITIYIVYHFQIPSSQVRRLAVHDFHIKKPDADNLTKFIMDALKGVCYYDDCQVTRLQCEKVYNLAAKTVIEIERME